MALTTMSEFTREKRYVIKSATCLIGSFAIYYFSDVRHVYIVSITRQEQFFVYLNKYNYVLH